MAIGNRSLLSYKDKKKRGFTLFEVLVSVLIIVILLVVAMPNIISAKESMEKAELQAAARQIYLAVQNRLTILKVSDNLGTVDPESPSFTYGDVAKEIIEKPVDCSDEDWSKARLYSTGYKKGAVPSLFDELLKGERLEDPEILSGRFTVEYDPNLGTVYGVFFSKGNFSYDAVKGTDRLPDTLYAITPSPVGYYGGGLTASAPPAPAIPPVAAIELVNEEDLYLKIVNPPTTQDITYLLEIKSATAPNYYKTYKYRICDTIDIGDPTAYIDGSTTPSTLGNVKKDASGNIRVIFDSLDDGKHFYQLFPQGSIVGDKPQIPPGDDIVVSIKSYFTAADPALGCSPEQVKNGNSLFAHKITNKDAAQEIISFTAQLNWGRHLQNLALGISKLSLLPTTENGAIDPMKHIVSAKVIEKPPEFADPSINWNYYTLKGRKFVSIVNGNLNSFDGGGSGTPIKNLNIAPNPDNPTQVGMLSSFTLLGSTISNVHMESPIMQLSGSNFASVGLVVGHLENAAMSNIDNIHLTSPTMEISGNSSASLGLLAGNLKNVDVTNCMITSTTAYHPNLKTASGNQIIAAGALIGTTTDCNVTNIDVQNTNIEISAVSVSGSIGGLVGNAKNTKSAGAVFSNITSNDNTVKNDIPTQRVGGIIGYLINENTSATAKLELKDSTVRNLALNAMGGSNITVREEYVGGVVGEGVNIKLNNTKLISPNIESSTSVTGGIVGKLEGSTVHKCGVHKEGIVPATMVLTASTYGGGVVGLSKNTEYTKSYSAFESIDSTLVTVFLNIPQSRATGIGGFIGYSTADTFSSCYANTRLMKGRFNYIYPYGSVGGFGSLLQGSTANNCYSIGKIIKERLQTLDYFSRAPGFCSVRRNNTTATTLRSCYAFCDLLDTQEYQTATPSKKNKPFLYRMLNNESSIQRCHYAKSLVLTPLEDYNSINAHNYPGDLDVADMNQGQPGGATPWKKLEAGETFPYSSGFQAPYPYPGLVDVPHYGDWPPY